MIFAPLVAQVVVLSLAGSSLVLAQGRSSPPLPDLGSVGAIHITGYNQMTGPDRDIALCLMEKLGAKGPFTFPDSPDSADAILTWTSKIPSEFSRHMWGRPPEIAATLAAPNGRVIWTGKNRFKKSTTLWGAHADIPCGLANGLVNKLVRDMEEQRKAPKRP
jgi:hypothetical protein